MGLYQGNLKRLTFLKLKKILKFLKCFIIKQAKANFIKNYFYKAKKLKNCIS